MLLPLSVIRPLCCQSGSRYQLGGGVQTNPNLPTIAQQKGVFNPHPARTLLRPPSNTERSACSVSLTLSSFYIHINLHLILNSPTFTQIFCSPIQFTSLGLIQKQASHKHNQRITTNTIQLILIIISVTLPDSYEHRRNS